MKDKNSIWPAVIMILLVSIIVAVLFAQSASSKNVNSASISTPRAVLTPTSYHAPTATPTKYGYISNVDSGAYVFAEADKASDKVAKIKKGEQVIILDEDGFSEWCKIRYENIDAYIPSQYLATNSQQTIKVNGTPKPTATTLKTASPTFEEIYKAYKGNELTAKEKYYGNRYTITGKINGIKTGGLMNLAGGATLTMEKKVGNTRCFFYAEFEKDQEANLKKYVVGDTITFTGKCLSWGMWTDCMF